MLHVHNFTCFKNFTQLHVYTFNCSKIMSRHLKLSFYETMRFFCLKLLALVVVVMANHLEDSVDGGQHDFNWLALIHSSICSPHHSCPTGASSSNVSAYSLCCGTCTCEPDCEKYGVCCLGQYKNLDHAKESTENNRYIKCCTDKQGDSNSEVIVCFVLKGYLHMCQRMIFFKLCISITQHI